MEVASGRGREDAAGQEAGLEPDLAKTYVGPFGGYSARKHLADKQPRDFGDYVRVREAFKGADERHEAMVAEVALDLGLTPERGHHPGLYRDTELGPRFPDIGNNIVMLSVEIKAGEPRMPSSEVQLAKERLHLERRGMSLWFTPDMSKVPAALRGELDRLQQDYPDTFRAVELTPENRERVFGDLSVLVREQEHKMWSREERRRDLAVGMLEQKAYELSKEVLTAREKSQQRHTTQRGTAKAQREYEKALKQYQNVAAKLEQAREKVVEARTVLAGVSHDRHEARMQQQARQQTLDKAVDAARSRVIAEYEQSPQHREAREQFQQRERELSDAMSLTNGQQWSPALEQKRSELLREQHKLRNEYGRDLAAAALTDKPVTREGVQASMERFSYIAGYTLDHDLAQTQARVQELSFALKTGHGVEVSPQERERLAHELAGLNLKIDELALKVDPLEYLQEREYCGLEAVPDPVSGHVLEHDYLPPTTEQSQRREVQHQGQFAVTAFSPEEIQLAETVQEVSKLHSLEELKVRQQEKDAAMAAQRRVELEQDRARTLARNVLDRSQVRGPGLERGYGREH